jgi:hypothetical protein
MIKVVKFWYAPLLIACLAILFGWRTIYLPWALIDDHELIMVGTKLSQAARDGQFESFFRLGGDVEAGRIRPGFWVEWWLWHELFNLDSVSYHTARLGQYAIAGMLSVMLARQTLLGSEWGGFVSGLIFIASGFHIELWQRLRPQEPLLVISFGLSLLAMHQVAVAIQRNRNPMPWFIVAVVCAWVGLTFKETAIVIFPVSLLMWRLTYRDWPSEIRLRWQKWAGGYVAVVFLGVVILGTAIVMSFINRIDLAYSHRYAFDDGPGLMTRIAIYALPILLPYILFLPVYWIVFREWRRANLTQWVTPFLQRGWVWVWMGWFLSFYILQLPWGMPQSYYTLTMIFALCPVSVLGIMLFVQVVKNNPWPTRGFLMGILGLCAFGALWLNLSVMDDYLDRVTERHFVDLAMVEFLSANASPGESLWFNENHQFSEVAGATADMLEFIHHQPRPYSSYIEPTSKFAVGDWVLSRVCDFRLPNTRLQPVAQFSGQIGLQWCLFRVAGDGN